MSNYSQTTFFAPKDLLASGNPAKIIFGAQIDPELAAIAVAIATKYDSSSISSTPVAFNAGTSSAPGIAFTGGTNANTGMYLAGANALGFAVNGLAALVSTSSGAWTMGSSAQAQNAYLLSMVGNSTSGQSFGLNVKAGTTSADTALLVQNQSGGSTFLQILGDGEAFISSPTAATSNPGWQLGYLEMPQNSQAGSYQLVMSDRGKFISLPSGVTLTVPANSSVAFPIGTTIMVLNGGIGTVTIASTDTLDWIPSGTTGNRSLGKLGLATLYKTAATQWLVWGFGIS